MFTRARANPTTDLGAITRGVPDPSWEHAASIWFADAGLLLAIAISLSVLLVYQLSRLDPPRASRRPKGRSGQ